MNDRGEKIVSLAREMLLEADSSTPSKPLPIKAMTVVAVIAATSAGAAVNWHSEQLRPLNRYEKIELVALMHYAAQTNARNTDDIRNDFYTHFELQSLDDMRRGHFDLARHWLQQRIPLTRG